MSRLLRFSPPLVALCLATSLQAQSRPAPAPSSRAYDRCMQAAETNAAFQDCGERELTRQEALLTAAWRAANAMFDPFVTPGPEYDEEMVRSKQALLAEQRAWIHYKDLACRQWLDGFGREGQVIHFYSCRIGVVADRVRDLKERVSAP
jgi:uncharacterized protein YecT (DUF1311 family)